VDGEEKMTPIQFVKLECANYQVDGCCLGVRFDEYLRHRGFTPRKECLVARRRRCIYFEECVAPMQHVVTEPVRAKAIQEAVAEYRQITNQKAAGYRACPVCGEPLQTRKRLCPMCASKAKRQSNRARRIATT